MKKYLIITALIFSLSNAFGQSVNNLNGFLYLHIYPVTYNGGQTDIYGIMPEVRNVFVDKGYGYISDFNDINQQFKNVTENPCIVLFCSVSHEAPGPYTNAEVTLTFTNCFNQIVYKTIGKGGTASTYQRYFAQAVKKALREFSSLNYKYNASLTPKIVYPEVEKTEETEESLKEYYTNNSLNSIEGIYKSYQAENMPYYKIGIKKRDNKFIAIIIEAEQENIWKLGEVKAYFEPSSMKGFFSVKWHMGNKTPYETFAMMENDAILSIEFKNPQTDEKRTDKFIKMYPPAEGEISLNKVQKSCGSGFFLTADGVVATNAHVVENAESIKIQISNEIGNFEYKAKVLLVDSKNDVALLKIEDEDFKGLSEIPYSLNEKAEIGEKAFTIGYPLNDVMGSNYKVTDGIVSSISGIDDDMRYYQISVPLQPGNSGGPLFNSSGDVIGITSARLNSKTLGTEVENVNYAIKISYLLNLYNMLPNSEQLNTTASKSTKELQDQVKILRNYVCLIKVN
ncbi:MAG TPA: trypsin-like peptidase domain-containing protein [Bacteroidia bacterium]|nr:trypsin-like peptidase domain-containing protein [Bacteroidia bacterium]